MWTRRRFVGWGVVALLGGAVRGSASGSDSTRGPVPHAGSLRAAQPAATANPVRVHLIGEDPGATLALDEMSRTASLLGRSIDRSPHEQAITIDIDEHALSAAGRRYSVAASDAARSAAVAAWRERGAASAVEWHDALQRFGAEQLNERFTRRFGVPMGPRHWMSWMLVKIAVDAQLREVALEAARFDGHKGVPLVFGADGHLVQPLCVVDRRGALLGVSEP